MAKREGKIDPELISALQVLDLPELTEQTLPVLRSGLPEMLAAMPECDSSKVSVTEEFIQRAGGSGSIRVLIYKPVKDLGPRPGILHIHGGGYVLGCPEMNTRELVTLVQDTGCVIASVDYRLAPETCFPGQLEDCYDVLNWLSENAEKCSISRNRIGVWGESAGGGIAAGLVLYARDRGGPDISAQFLVYPMLDDRTGVTQSPHPQGGEHVWTPASNRYAWTCMLGKAPGGEKVSCYAAAARAENFEGLPPTFIAVGGLDLFLLENIDYARRLLNSGVETELHVYPGAYHGFDKVPGSRVAKEFNHDLTCAVKRLIC